MKLHNQGFTLIELLIVIAILGIITAGIIVIINPVAQIQKSHDARRKSDLHQISLALEQYYNDHGHYPIYCDSTTVTSGQAEPWIPELTSTYMSSVPTDPLNKYGGTKATTFQYQYESKKLPPMGDHTWVPCDNSGQSYVLGTHLEISSDPSVNWDFYDSFWGGWYINYVVTSHN